MKNEHSGRGLGSRQGRGPAEEVTCELGLKG